ncbi:hypothetical protein SO3561_00796 [Streptomyces olivochromogenes]|uniref:Uncharacterized protein n=1 Tax=Streptomyces olivochromogenes TaxID=1963 RepID=A0A250V551_STROL|nr:hypothetical protein SO3561_00796 [Streptomyces olivochromogenes]
MSCPEAGRRVPHAEPPLSAVLLEPLPLCELRLHREAHRGVVDGPGAQHHRLVGRRGEPVQCSCARLGGVPAPPRLRQERVAELGLPGSQNLSPQPPSTVFPPARGNRTRSTLGGSRSTASSPLQDGQSHQLRQVMKRPVAKSLRLSSPRRDRPPRSLTQAAIKIRAMLGPGPTHRSLNRIRAAQRRADHVSPADEAPPGVLLGEAAGLLPVAEKGCLTGVDARQAPLLVSAGHGCAVVSGACGLRHDERVLDADRRVHRGAAAGPRLRARSRTPRRSRARRSSSRCPRRRSAGPRNSGRGCTRTPRSRGRR